MTDLKLFCDPDPKTPILPQDEGLIMDSHGSTIFGRLLLPARKNTQTLCPVVLMLHGYPGVEQNLDTAQLLRMAGYAVVHFSYRGVWGGHGDYCLSHLVEDVGSVAAYIRSRADEWRIDPERLYLLGHSMGGFAAVTAMAEGLKVKGAVMMAPCDIAHDYLYDRPNFDRIISLQEGGYFRTPSPDYIENDIAAHAQQWLFTNAAETLSTDVPYAFIGATQDSSTPTNSHIQPLLHKLRAKGAKAQYTELRDEHSFPAHRMQLAGQIIAYLKEMDAQ